MSEVPLYTESVALHDSARGPGSARPTEDLAAEMTTTYRRNSFAVQMGNLVSPDSFPLKS